MTTNTRIAIVTMISAIIIITTALIIQITSIPVLKPINVIPSLTITNSVFHCIHDKDNNVLLQCISHCKDFVWQPPTDGAIHINCPDCCKVQDNEP